MRIMTPGGLISALVSANLGAKVHMREQDITKVEMARRMETSRSPLARLLNPGESGVTLETMSRAAKTVNRQLRLELV